MRRLLTVVALAALLLLVSSFAGQSFTTTASASNLEFVPLIQVAPDAPTKFGAATPACTTPAPVFTYAFFHCYTPAEMTAAYGIDTLHAQGLTGKGQTIVIVDSYGSPTALADLQKFSQTFGLPAPDLTIYYPNGKPTYSNSMHGVQVGWAFETSLDLQWAHAIAPDAKIVLVAANPAETQGVQGFPGMFLGIQHAVNTYPGSVISQSFAVTEQSFHSAADVQVARFDKVYQQAAANHITVIGASGDSGTANGDKQGRLYPFPTVNWPSSDPLVTSAGGTWLQYGWKWNPSITAAQYYSCLATAPDSSTCDAQYLAFNTGPGRTEAVWKEDWLPAATGGGLSVLFPEPTFQSSVPQNLLNGKRGLPDLSWNAAVDGGALVYTSFGGVRVGWHVVGGTSASTPQLAGMIALANQLADQQGKQHHVGRLDPLLYQLPPSDFNDIVPQTFGVETLDSNAQFGAGVPGMSTLPGWDLTTGFGSPKAANLVPDLVNLLP